MHTRPCWKKSDRWRHRSRSKRTRTRCLDVLGRKATTMRDSLISAHAIWFPLSALDVVLSHSLTHSRHGVCISRNRPSGAYGAVDVTNRGSMFQGVCVSCVSEYWTRATSQQRFCKRYRTRTIYKRSMQLLVNVRASCSDSDASSGDPDVFTFLCFLFPLLRCLCYCIGGRAGAVVAKENGFWECKSSAVDTCRAAA